MTGRADYDSKEIRAKLGLQAGGGQSSSRRRGSFKSRRLSGSPLHSTRDTKQAPKGRGRTGSSEERELRGEA